MHWVVFGITLHRRRCAPETVTRRAQCCSARRIDEARQCCAARAALGAAPLFPAEGGHDGFSQNNPYPKMPSCKSVYEPQEDSTLLEKWVRQLSFGKVLDMGTGSGVQAIAAVHHEGVESVVATDISREAIAYCRRNARHPKITCRVSDLFSAFGKGKRHAVFDTLIFNPPYLPAELKPGDISLEGGRKGYETIERFLKGANDHLENEGIILLLFSSLTKKEKVDAFIRENLFGFELLEKRHYFFEDLFVYRIAKTPLLRELSSAGISGMGYYARGKRGLVYAGTLKGRKVAVKVANPSSRAVGKIRHEAEMLGKLNRKGIGPRLIAHTDRYLVEEFIGGDFIGGFIASSSGSAIRKVIKMVMEQMRILDGMGIMKEEMQRPHKHIIVCEGKPVLLDFERAHHALKPGNVTQFCQYLIGTALTGMLREKNINIDKEHLIGLAREYKNAPSGKGRAKAFRAIEREIMIS